MQQQNNNHCAGAVIMETAQKLPRSNLLCNISNAGVRRVHRRNVIDRETKPGNHLRYKNKYQARPKNVGQSRTTRNGFIKRRMHQAAYTGPFVKPTIDSS
jgi:hypothetical protein